MKNLYLLFFALLLINIIAYSQNRPGAAATGPKGEITGHLIDSATKKILDYATVSLLPVNSKSSLGGVLSNDAGDFRIKDVPLGTYNIRVSYVGYTDKFINSVKVTEAGKAVSLGTVSVAAGGKTLKEVSIVSRTPLVENKIDKLVYNVEKDITASGGTATDVLGKVPMVAVDLNGNVSVRGDQNVRVLINGKATGSSAANVSDILRSIPADQIKNIEVITSPSAKYDAEGSAGILNIITKSKNVSGVSGSVSGGIGTLQNNGNLNLNINKNKFHSSFNLGGFYSWPATAYSSFDQQIKNDTINTHTITTGTSQTKRHALNASVNAGYDFDTLNSISTNFRYFRFQFSNNGISNTVAATPYSFSSNSVNAFGNFDWSIDYTKKFRKKGEELDLSAQWSRGIGTSDYTNIYTSVFPNLQNNIDGVNNEYTFQADYTLPISKIFKLEAGGKNILRRINSTSDYYNSTTGTNFVFDPINSNVYRYDQNVYAGYSVATLTLAKTWSVLAGIRDEITNINGDPENASQALAPFHQSYNTLIPSLTIQKQLKGMNTLKLVYSERITRPSLQFLNPFINRSNPQSQTVGNPTLSPEVSHTIEGDYTAFFGSSTITAGLYYRRTNNLIEGIAAPIAVTINGVKQGGTLTTYQNIGSNNSLGSNVFMSVNPFKILTISGNINIFTYNPDPTGLYSSQLSQSGTYFIYNGFLRGSLTLPKDIIGEVFSFGGSQRRTIQGTTPAFALYGLGIRKQFKKKTMSIGLNATQPFAKYKHFDSEISSPGFTQTSINKVPFQSFGVTFSYNFGKLSFGGQRPQEKRINNDDLKQNDNNQGQGQGGR